MFCEMYGKSLKWTQGNYADRERIPMGSLKDAVQNLPDQFEVDNQNHLRTLEQLTASLRELLGGQIHFLVSRVHRVDAIVSDTAPKVIKVLEIPGFISITDPTDQKLADQISTGFTKYPRLRSTRRVCAKTRSKMKLNDSIVNLERTRSARLRNKKTEEDVLTALLHFQCKLAEKLGMVVIFIL